MRKITLNTFRRLHVAEEQMMRAMMPRTSESDPQPLPKFAAPEPGEVLAVRGGLRLVRPLASAPAQFVGGGLQVSGTFERVVEVARG